MLVSSASSVPVSARISLSYVIAHRICCASVRFFPKSQRLSNASSPYAQIRRRSQSSLISISGVNHFLTGGCAIRSIQSASHLRVDLSVDRSRYAIRHESMYSCRHVAVHVISTSSLTAYSTSVVNGKPCANCKSRTGLSLAARRHLSLLLVASGNGV